MSTVLGWTLKITYRGAGDLNEGQGCETSNKTRKSEISNKHGFVVHSLVVVLTDGRLPLLRRLEHEVGKRIANPRILSVVCEQQEGHVVRVGDRDKAMGKRLETVRGAYRRRGSGTSSRDA